MVRATEAGAPERLEKSVEIGTLCAYYGGLLTDKQLEALRLHYDEDLSLGEIAGQLGVSRQNVHELITRSTQKLKRYENALGGARKTSELLRRLTRVNELLKNALDTAMPPEARRKVEAAATRVAQTISQQEGEETDHGL